MAEKYCLNPLQKCKYRAARTGDCVTSEYCGYKVCFIFGISKETELLLRNMCAIQIQNEEILTLLRQQKQK